MSKNDPYRRLAESLSDEQKERVNKFLSECEPSGTYEEIQTKLKRLFNDKNDVTIRGWVAVDEMLEMAYIYAEKPQRRMREIADTGDYECYWDCLDETFPDGNRVYLLDRDLFPEMDFDSDPVEVELTIKKIEK
ncbi:MAG: hypothetical protein K1W14_06510 [Muribaculaceae bacterium]